MEIQRTHSYLTVCCDAPGFPGVTIAVDRQEPHRAGVYQQGVDWACLGPEIVDGEYLWRARSSTGSMIVCAAENPAAEQVEDAGFRLVDSSMRWAGMG